ncbi:ribbon-helix-helix domain-containing protein [Candidatus Microgenomates bacterium]|nr:MAG: ribbon-helix-helix domain-containing protein [Candidatus Microgenomates bacterium]
MKAYFTASIVGKRHHLANYKKIVEILKKKGLEVQADHILDTTEEYLKQETKEERVKFQHRLQKWITSADFIIAETSYPSISVGFEISLAAQMLKPVLMLFSEGDAPSLLAVYKDEHVVSQKYDSDTLEEIISDFVTYVEGSNDTRFTFFITSEIAAYLDRLSKKEKIPKSVYLRRLIKEDQARREQK